MPILRPLFNVTARSTALLVNIASKGSSLVIDVDLHEPNAPSLQILFDDLVGYRVLDERDLPQFWHSAENKGVSDGCLLYEVTSGGWAGEHMAQSSVMAAGFYPRLREWLILGTDWCVSILSDGQREPHITER